MWHWYSEENPIPINTVLVTQLNIMSITDLINKRSLSRIALTRRHGPAVVQLESFILYQPDMSINTKTSTLCFALKYGHTVSRGPKSTLNKRTQL